MIRFRHSVVFAAILTGLVSGLSESFSGKPKGRLFEQLDFSARSSRLSYDATVRYEKPGGRLVADIVIYRREPARVSSVEADHPTETGELVDEEPSMEPLSVNPSESLMDGGDLMTEKRSVILSPRDADGLKDILSKNGYFEGYSVEPRPSRVMDFGRYEAALRFQGDRVVRVTESESERSGSGVVDLVDWLNEFVMAHSAEFEFRYTTFGGILGEYSELSISATGSEEGRVTLRISDPTSGEELVYLRYLPASGLTILKREVARLPRSDVRASAEVVDMGVHRFYVRSGELAFEIEESSSRNIRTPLKPLLQLLSRIRLDLLKHGQPLHAASAAPEATPSRASTPPLD